MAQYASSYGMEMVVKNNFLPQLLKEFGKIAQETQKEAVLDVAHAVQEQAPVDTTAMKVSVYVAYKTGSNYNFVVARARELRPNWDVFNPKVEINSEMEVGLGVAEGYAGFVEFGHHSKDGGWVPAQPFFWPVVQSMGSYVRAKMESVPARAIRAAGG